MENALLNNEHRYKLLLSAQLGGHIVDCYPVIYCEINELRETENYYIDLMKPCLNILTPTGKNDIGKLKIEDVLADIESRLKRLKVLENSEEAAADETTLDL